MKKLDFWSRSWRGILLIGVCLISYQLSTLWLRNNWSLNYSTRLFRSSAPTLMVPPEVIHRRANIWLAREAIDLGDPVLAQSLITADANLGVKHAQIILGDAYDDQGESGLAIDIWVETGEFDFFLRRAETAEAEGNQVDALQAYQSAYRIDREFGTLPLAEFMLQAMQDPILVEDLVRTSLAEFPASTSRTDWLLVLSKALLSQQRWEEAKSTLQQLLKEKPEDWQAYIELMWAQYEGGEGLDAVLATFRQAVAVDPFRGDVYYAQGLIFMREQMYSEAEDSFAQAVDRYPGVVWWWYSWGNAAFESGNFSQAIAIYQQALELYPQSAPLYLELAQAYHDSGLQQEAIRSIETAIALMEPPNAWYYYRAGSIYESAGETAKALAAYQEAVRLDPESELALEVSRVIGGIHYAQGLDFMGERMYSEAEDSFAQAVDRYPGVMWWWYSWGNAAFESGNFSQAIAIYLEALELYPQSAPLYLELAWAYQFSGMQQEAIQAIETAIALMEPPNAWYYYRAGSIYESVGEVAIALAAYQEAVRLDPENELALAGLERLEE